MAGKLSSKKEQRRAKLAERNPSEEKLDEEASLSCSTTPLPPDEGEDDDFGLIKGSIKLAERRKASSSSAKVTVSIREVSHEENAKDLENAIQLPEQEFYKKMDDELNAVPEIGNAFDGILRNMIRITTQSWNSRFGALPCLRGKNLAWLQLLLVDQQKTAQVKLYALGSRVAMAKDDSDVVQRSRKLFQDAAPVFMNHYGLWVFSRSMVRKGYSGVFDQDAFNFASYDPLGNLEELPMDPSAGIRCAEIFLFFAVDGDIPGDLCSREAVLEFLEGLNTKKGARKIHGFYVVAGSVVSKTDKLQEVKGEHVAVYERDLPST